MSSVVHGSIRVVGVWEVRRVCRVSGEIGVEGRYTDARAWARVVVMVCVAEPVGEYSTKWSRDVGCSARRNLPGGEMSRSGLTGEV